MKTSKILLAAASLVVFAAPAALAVPSNTATSNASVEIVTPISISNTSALDFGHVAKSASSGTAVMSDTGIRSATGGVTLASASGVTPTQATFTINGDPNANFAITLPTTVTLNDGGSNTLDLDTFTSSLGASNTIGGAGSSNLSVGATLNVASNQANGSYTGTFDVTVDYN